MRIARTAEALAVRGHDVHVVTYHLGEGAAPSAVTVHRTPSVPTYRRMAPGPSYQKLAVMDPLLALQLRRVQRDHDFDVIHAHHVEGLSVALLSRRRGTPVVFDAHTLIGSELPFYELGLPASLLKRVGTAIDRWLPARADHVITVTEDIKVRLMTECGLGGDRVSVIENGVLWDRFNPHTEARGEQDEPVIVFAGNLAPYQGIEALLVSFERVHATHPNAKLVLATEDESGFDPYRGLAERLRIDQRVSLQVTSFAELPEVLSEASVAVNPRSKGDGMPMKILNYMAAGLPIVSFAGSAKGVEHLRTAWVAPDDDIDAFAQGITRLIDDRALATRMGAEARRQVMRGGSWDAVAQKVERVYASVRHLGHR